MVAGSEGLKCSGLLPRAHADGYGALPLLPQDFASGKAQLVAPPVAGGVLRSTPDRLPAVVQMTESQKQHLQEHMEAALAAKRGQKPLSPGSQAPPPGRLQQEGVAVLAGSAPAVKEETGVKQEDGNAAEAAEAAIKEEPSSRLEAASSEQTSGQDMPELPAPDE